MTATSDSRSVEFNPRGLVLLTSLLIVLIATAAVKDQENMKPANKPHVVTHIQFDGMSEVDMTIQRCLGDRYYLYVQYSKPAGVSIIDISKPENPKAVGVVPAGDELATAE